ncbi:MAG: hypothetical protein ACTSU9_00755 [Promethearchaeota archaeon]
MSWSGRINIHLMGKMGDGMDEVDTVLPMEPRRRERRAFSKKVVERDGELMAVKNVVLAVYALDNPIIKKLIAGEDVLDDLIAGDREVDLELTGRFIRDKHKILMDDHDDFVYSYDEYEVIKDPSGNVVREVRIEEKPKDNVNDKDNPVKFITTIGRLDAIKKFAFKSSYAIHHVDGLSYIFVRKIAEELHENQEMVLVAPVKKVEVDGVVKKLPQRLRLRTGRKRAWGWLEGRIRGDEYALILHLTSMELK